MLFWHKRGENHQKLTKNMFFWSEWLGFWKHSLLSAFAFVNLFQRSTREICYGWLFKRSTKWFNHGSSFEKIDKSDSIWSIFLKDRREGFDHSWSFSKIEKIKRLKLTLLFIFLGIPSCLGDAIKQKEKEKERERSQKKD